jgi:hypothetical protein
VHGIEAFPAAFGLQRRVATPAPPPRWRRRTAAEVERLGGGGPSRWDGNFGCGNEGNYGRGDGFKEIIILDPENHYAGGGAERPALLGTACIFFSGRELPAFGILGNCNGTLPRYNKEIIIL